MTKLNNALYRKARFAFVYTILILFSTAMISSCKKNILDKKSLGSFSDEQVWNDGALIETYINNIYRIMPNGFLNRIYTGFMGLTDEGTSRANTGNSIINAGNISPADLTGYEGYWSCSLDYWTNYYAVIKKCNEVLGKIDVAPIEASFRDRMKGEVTFLRAYSYFRLVSLHGGVPLIVKPFNINDDFNVPRSSYDECMDFVVSQLDAAAVLLPLEYTEINKGRVTKGSSPGSQIKGVIIYG